MQERTTDPPVDQVTSCDTCYDIREALAGKSSEVPQIELQVLGAAGLLDLDAVRGCITEDARALLCQLRDDINDALNAIEAAERGHKDHAHSLLSDISGRNPGGRPILEVAGPAVDHMLSESLTIERVSSLESTVYNFRSWCYNDNLRSTGSYNEERTSNETNSMVNMAIRTARKPDAVRVLCERIRGARHG